MSILQRLDQLQRRRAWLAFPYAVIRKFGEDRGGQQAALIAFYGFLSLFPLLLVAVTGLGIVLRDDPALQERVLGSALAAFPIVGEQIRENVAALGGSGVALAIGLAAALWGGLGGVNAVQAAMDEVWDVPVRARPGVPARIRRGLVMLAVLGTMTLLSTAIAAAGAAGAPDVLRVAAFAASFALNVAVFLVAFTILPARRPRWRDVLPGALVAGVAWMVLQAVGGVLIEGRLRGASETYGFFAIVLGLLWWLVLAAQVMLLAAEVNVVRRERLWPRSLGGEPDTDADRRALIGHADVEERVPSEQVSVRFDRRAG